LRLEWWLQARTTQQLVLPEEERATAPVAQENEEDSDPYNLVISDILGESQSTINPEGQPEPELPEAHEGPEFSFEELEKLLEVLEPGNAQNKQTAKDIHESPLPPAPVEIGGEIWPEGEAPLYDKTGALCQKRKHNTTTGSSSTSGSSTDNFSDLNVTENSGPKKKKTKAREDTEDRTGKKVEQEARKLKDQVEALEYMNQRLKINGELRDKTLKIQEELSTKYKKEIAELQTAAAKDKVEIAKRAPAALAADQGKNRVLKIKQGRQSQTIKSLDAQLSGLRSRNLFLDNQNRGLVRDRDVLTAEVDLERKRSAGLVNELQRTVQKQATAKTEAQGLVTKERLEFDVLEKDGPGKQFRKGSSVRHEQA
jgi:hypothetical protein